MSETLLSRGGTTVRLLVAEPSTTLLELELEPGSGAGPHVHTREDETIAVVAGRLAVDDGAVHELLVGDTVFLRRGVRHSFANDGGETVRAYVFCTPGGLERFFGAVARAESDADVAAAAERAGLAFG